MFRAKEMSDHLCISGSLFIYIFCVTSIWFLFSVTFIVANIDCAHIDKARRSYVNACKHISEECLSKMTYNG